MFGIIDVFTPPYMVRNKLFCKRLSVNVCFIVGTILYNDIYKMCKKGNKIERTHDDLFTLIICFTSTLAVASHESNTSLFRSHVCLMMMSVFAWVHTNAVSWTQRMQTWKKHCFHSTSLHVQSTGDRWNKLETKQVNMKQCKSWVKHFYSDQIT